MVDGFGEFGAGGLHAGAVEAAAHFQFDGALGTGLGEGLTGGVDSGDFAGDDELAGVAVVGAGEDAGVERAAHFLDFLVGEADDGGHGGGVELAGALHSLSAGADEAQGVGELEGAGGNECGELAERVAGGHVGFHLALEGLGEGHGVNEDGGLGDARLFELVVGAAEHNVCDAEAQDVVGFLHHGLDGSVAVIQVFAHAHKL